MTNPTNIFNYIPHDVTQWKITPFLTAEERATFNSVLEPTERVWQRLPDDFAIKHSLKTFIKAQRNHIACILQILDQSNIIIRNPKLLKKAIQTIKHYVTFIGSLQARLIYQYKDKAKKSACNDLTIFLDSEDFPYRLHITQEFRDQMYDALNFVEGSQFIRDVNP